MFIKYVFTNIILLFINKLFITYDFILKVLCILNSDVRREIFIGVTGLMVAIIIFIAEIISSKDYELERRLILDKTKITYNVGFCVVIFLLMLISSFFSITSDSLDEIQYFKCDILFVVLQLLINAFVLAFMYNTVRIFCVVVKLNTDREYYNIELDKYIHKRVKMIEYNATNKSLENMEELRKKFNDYITNNKFLSAGTMSFCFSDNFYVPITVDQSGIIKDYDYDQIDLIIENINDISSDDIKENLSSVDIIFEFIRNIGDRVEKNSIIGYCLKGYQRYFKDISKCIIYDSNSMYIDEEIKLINDNLFDKANMFNAPLNFDDNKRLYNYFRYLYDNDLKGVRIVSLLQLREMARLICQDEYKNKSYLFFLNKINVLAYNYEEVDEYREISDVIYFLYYQQLQMSDIDVKRVCFNYSNNYFKYEYFLVKKCNNIKFYDKLLSNLLSIITDLIVQKKMMAISIIFKNINLDCQGPDNSEFDEKNIFNLQFAIGIIFCIYMFVENNNLSDDDKIVLNSIIDWTNNHFVNTYDAWSLISNFKRYFNKCSDIQKVYSKFEYSFVDHEYQSSYSAWGVDEKKILRELLCAFKMRYYYKNDIDLNEITADDKYYFESLLEILNYSEKTKFENELCINFNKSAIIEVLELVVAEADKKEKEYIKFHELDYGKIDEFEKILREEVHKKNELESYLHKLKKIENVNVKLKRVYGTSQLLPRDMYFSTSGGYEVVAEQLSELFHLGIEEEFIKKIERIAVNCNEKIDDILDGLENLNDYILISNYIYYFDIDGYDASSDSIKINGKSLDILKFSNVECLYLIKKNFLPVLQYCRFSNSYSLSNVDKSFYYEFNDCSNNEDIRKDIIKNSSWLLEKGSISEQHEYLKQQCSLKIYLSFRFFNIKGSEAIKFVLNAEN